MRLTSCSMTEKALKKLNVFCSLNDQKNHSIAIENLVDFWNKHADLRTVQTRLKK